jgi:hypothetical protein
MKRPVNFSRLTETGNNLRAEQQLIFSQCQFAYSSLH